MSLLLTAKTTYAIDDDIIEGPDIIYKQDDRVLVMSDIIDLFSYQDNELIILNDAYTGYGDIPGIYQVTVAAADDETIFKTFSISVRNYIGDITAVILEDETYTIYVSKDKELEKTDIIDVMVNINVITVTSQTQVNYLSDNYSDNSNAPGLYTFEFRIATTSGIEETYLMNILVSNSDTLIPDLELDPEPSWVSQNATIIFLGILISASIFILIKKVKK
jgi:hypothetical protein